MVGVSAAVAGTVTTVVSTTVMTRGLADEEDVDLGGAVDAGPGTMMTETVSAAETVYVPGGMVPKSVVVAREVVVVVLGVVAVVRVVHGAFI